jgi:type II secretion system protein N
LKNAEKGLKFMSRTVKWLLWGLYGVALVLIFVYYLFPSDALREYAAAKIKSRNPDLSLRTKRIAPAFPPGVTIYGADLLNKEQVWIETDYVRILPGIMSLFGKDRRFSFKGTAWKGNFNGQTIVSTSAADNEDALKASAFFSGIRVEQIKALQEMSGRKIASGILAGNISFHQKKTGESFESKIAITGLGIDIVTPMMKLPTVTFKSADAEIISADMKIIDLRQCNIKGEQANGNITGTITTQTPFEKSLIDLKADITPNPSFIAGITKSFPAASLLLNNKKGGMISFKIGGTIEQPTFSLK